MDSKDYWKCFIETGAPEMYLLYAKARKSEEAYVSKNESFGHSRYGVS